MTRRPEGESTFNVFYYMMAGVESSLRSEWTCVQYGQIEYFCLLEGDIGKYERLLLFISHCVFPPRTELHLNHFSEHNAFGITPQTKVSSPFSIENSLCLFGTLAIKSVPYSMNLNMCSVAG